MDIVICLATKDYKIVKKVVRNCRTFLLSSEEDALYLITNEKNKCLFSTRWLSENGACIIDEDKLLKGLSFEKVREALKQHFNPKINIYAGWYFQQFLKMGFALSDYAKDEYLIWDSDTIPLHKLCFRQSKKYLFTVKTEHHIPYFDTINQLLGFSKLYDRSFIAEHMPIATKVMRELIAEIEKSDVSGDVWWKKIVNATSGHDEQAFSEFETYGTYCVKYHPDIFNTRPLVTMRTAGMLFGRGVKRNQLALLSKMGFDTASFELRDIPKFPRNIPNWWERIVLRLYREIGFVKK